MHSLCIWYAQQAAHTIYTNLYTAYTQPSKTELMHSFAHLEYDVRNTAHITFNQVVRGSSPRWLTYSRKAFIFKGFGAFLFVEK